MPVEINDKGIGNKIELHPWFEQHGRLRIDLAGNNNIIRMPHAPRSCNGMHIQLGNDSSVDIGSGCSLTNSFIFTKRNGHIRIGNDTSFTSQARLVMHEASRIDIGDDCMIASDVRFLTSDIHTIYDVESNSRINPAGDIQIGDHVWIALQCLIMKGVRIGANSVIGIRSTVMHDIPKHCLAAGAPARVLRTGINWDRQIWAEKEAASGQMALPEENNPL
jgi:acetyltransferase-like isoleucine patch superfamily enzyme